MRLTFQQPYYLMHFPIPPSRVVEELFVSDSELDACTFKGSDEDRKDRPGRLCKNARSFKSALLESRGRIVGTAQLTYCWLSLTQLPEL